MKELLHRRLIRRLCAASLCLLLTTGFGASASADYIHGYFRYTVEDHSVTITAYFGPETEVYVPAMIGGNPVNCVAADAFRGSGVQTVYLPDTVDTVMDGAFDKGQQVYVQPAGENGRRPDPSLGIPTDSGGIVTTDDQGRLLHVDENGVETVLDPDGGYTRGTEDGQVVIRSADGTAVTVSGGSVSFSRGGEPLTAELGAGIGSAPAADADTEEAEVTAEEDAFPAAPSAEASAEAPAAAESSSLFSLRLWVLMGLSLIAVLLVCAALFAKKKKRARKPRR